MDTKNMIRRWGQQLCVLLLLMSGVSAAVAADQEIWRPADGQKPRWKALLVAGDMEDGAFYNGVHALAHMLEAGGVQKQDIVILTPYGEVIGADTEYSNVYAKGEALGIGPGDACLIFLTSHGTQGGLNIRGRGKFYTLSPGALNSILDATCKKAPSVVVTSGCYSGVYLQGAMPAPNRIIVTAARFDRDSFGCNGQLEFTYYDFCFLAGLPGAKSWAHLSARTQRCVSVREERGRRRASEPQFFSGSAMSDISIPAVPVDAYRALWRIVPSSLAEANSIPFGGFKGKQSLKKYKEEPGAKALAAGVMGGWSWRSGRVDGETASKEALAACEKHSGEECLLYAVDDRLVWHDSVRTALPTAEAFFQRIGLSD